MTAVLTPEAVALVRAELDRAAEEGARRKAQFATARTGAQRIYDSVVYLLRDFGAEVPEKIAAAGATLRDARALARDTRIAAALSTDPHTIDGILDGGQLRQGTQRAAKAHVTAQAEADVAAAVVPAAEARAARAVHESTHEVLDCVLASARLAAILTEAETCLRAVPPETRARPHEGDLDAVANLALLRRALAPVEAVYMRLGALDLVTASGKQFAPLLFADPTGANLPEVIHALSGTRPGNIGVPVHRVSAHDGSHPLGGVMAPMDEPGIPSALLAAVPGVVIRPAATAADLHARVAFVEGGYDTGVQTVFCDCGCGPTDGSGHLA